MSFHDMKLTDEQVIEARRAYGAREISQPKLAKLLGLGQANISHMLLGRTYKHLPGAVEPRKRCETLRTLTFEQVHEARLAFKTGNFSVRDLGEYYGISRTAMHRVLTGKFYRDVPDIISIEDMPPSRKRENRRPVAASFTREEAAQAKLAVTTLIAKFGDMKGVAAGMNIPYPMILRWKVKGYISTPQIEVVARTLDWPNEKVRPDRYRPEGPARMMAPRPGKKEMALLIGLALQGRLKGGKITMPVPRFDDEVSEDD